jgi:aspartyl-tRNA(Asn)/glutamyl-tRNA(Gln) amidotransferase subunit B
MVPVIGLEIHVQLNTKTKLFCLDKNDPRASKPNFNVCPICLGSPGTLPVPNQEAIDKVLLVALALKAEINHLSKFDRKNYFYPNLPKGYQISQYDLPLAEGGFLVLSGGKKVRIRRVHLEEDTGRMIHAGGVSLLDYNRAGVPLMELVTEPDLTSAQEASDFGKELQVLFRYLKVSEADMEKGQLRVEANISLQPKSEIRNPAADPSPKPKSETNSKSRIPNSKLGSKVELKNLNSFKCLREAIDYEIKRQADLLKAGKKVSQETRGWNEKRRRTFTQRVKETEADYRYFPEPDIPPIQTGITKLNQLKKSLPELPQERRERFMIEYRLPWSDAQVLVADKDKADFFESLISESQVWEKVTKTPEIAREHRLELIRLAANYLINEVPKLAKGRIDWASFKITPENLAEFVVLVHQGKVSSSGAQKLLAAMYETGAEPDHLIRDLALDQISDESELKLVAKQVVRENFQAVQDYKQGKKTALQFLVGQMMAATKGRANPQASKKLLEEILSTKH